MKFTIHLKKEKIKYFNSLILNDSINLILLRKNTVFFINEDKNGIIRIVNYPTSSEEEASFKISNLTLSSILNEGFITFKHEEETNQLCIGYTKNKEKAEAERFSLVVKEPYESMNYDSYGVYLSIYSSKELISTSSEFSQNFNIMLKMCAINEEGLTFKNNMVYNVSDNKYIFMNMNCKEDFALTSTHLKELAKIKEEQTYTKFNNYLIARTDILTLAIGTAYANMDFDIPAPFLNDDYATMKYTVNLLPVVDFLKSLSKTLVNKMVTASATLNVENSTLNLILNQIQSTYKLNNGNLIFNKTANTKFNFRIDDLIDLCKFLTGCKLENTTINFLLYQKNIRLNFNNINILLRLESEEIK